MSYGGLVEQSLRIGDYQTLARLLTLPTSRKSVQLQVQELINSSILPSISLQNPYYGTIVLQFVKMFASTTTDKERLELSLSNLQTFLKSFTQQEGNAEVPILKALCENVFITANHLDKYALRTGGKAENLEEAARLLSRCFTACITDRSPLEVSKKWAALRIVVLLFKVYFKINTLRLCGNIIRAIEQSEFPPITTFPKAESISYWYYRARICIHQKEFKKAESLLSDAFNLCHPQDLAHRREILIYLVTMKIIHGVLPKVQLLAQYNLSAEYGQLVEAVRKGNLALFDAVLAANQTFFMQKELYLIIQLYLKNLILRNCFRQIYLVTLSLPGAAESRLPLANLVAGFAVHGMKHVSKDEVECWTANLINEGFIKGYISHEKATLVLSKKNPFPPPSSLNI